MKVVIHNYLTRDSGTFHGKTVAQWIELRDRAGEYEVKLLQEYNSIAPTGPEAFAKRADLKRKMNETYLLVQSYNDKIYAAQVEAEQKMEAELKKKRLPPAGPYWRRKS